MCGSGASCGMWHYLNPEALSVVLGTCFSVTRRIQRSMSFPKAKLIYDHYATILKSSFPNRRVWGLSGSKVLVQHHPC